MLSSSSMAFSLPTSTVSSSSFSANPNKNLRALCCKKPISLSPSRVLELSFPLVASISVLLWSGPAHAGFLSGSKGLESMPGPELPQIDFLNKWNADNQKRYADLDSRFRSSTVLKELLEKSKLNEERNRRAIQDKYCLRGAEWGVGDCSTEGMTEEEKDAFISMLKKNVKE